MLIIQYLKGFLFSCITFFLNNKEIYFRVAYELKIINNDKKNIIKYY